MPLRNLVIVALLICAFAGVITAIADKGKDESATAATGSNRTRFSGRVGSRRLRVGSYRATIVETTAGARHPSAPRRAAFRIVAR